MIKIKNAPTELKGMEVSELVFEWIPSLNLKKGLSSELEISGEELLTGDTN